MINVSFNGNWAGVTLALRTLPLEVAAAAVWGQRKSAETLVKKVKGHINSQDLGWPQKSSQTLSNDPRILVDQGDYYAAIRAWKDGMTYYAGVKSSAINSRGARIVDYANMNEYGGGRLPARPLWQPTIREMGGNSGFRNIVIMAIYAKVQRLRTLGMDVKLGPL